MRNGGGGGGPVADAATIGGFWRQQQCGGQLEYRSSECRHIAAAIADYTSASVRLVLSLTSYSHRQLLANAAIVASRASAKGKPRRSGARSPFHSAYLGG